MALTPPPTLTPTPTQDKITSRLFHKKLEALVSAEANTLHRCAFCARLFTPAQREYAPRATPAPHHAALIHTLSPPVL